MLAAHGLWESRAPEGQDRFVIASANRLAGDLVGALLGHSWRATLRGCSQCSEGRQLAVVVGSRRAELMTARSAASAMMQTDGDDSLGHSRWWRFAVCEGRSKVCLVLSKYCRHGESGLHHPLPNRPVVVAEEQGPRRPEIARVVIPNRAHGPVGAC